KRMPVFRKDHDQSKAWGAIVIQSRTIAPQARRFTQEGVSAEASAVSVKAARIGQPVGPGAKRTAVVRTVIVGIRPAIRGPTQCPAGHQGGVHDRSIVWSVSWRGGLRGLRQHDAKPAPG